MYKYTVYLFQFFIESKIGSKIKVYDPKCLPPITVQKYIRYIEEWHQDAFYAILYDHLCVVSSVVVSKTKYVLCSTWKNFKHPPDFALLAVMC